MERARSDLTGEDVVEFAALLQALTAPDLANTFPVNPLTYPLVVEALTAAKERLWIDVETAAKERRCCCCIARCGWLLSPIISK
jgi:hypothetical protein